MDFHVLWKKRKSNGWLSECEPAKDSSNCIPQSQGMKTVQHHSIDCSWFRKEQMNSTHAKHIGKTAHRHTANTIHAKKEYTTKLSSVKRSHKLFFFWYFCCGFQAKFNSFVNLLFRFRLVLFYLAIFSFLQWLACSIAQSFDFVILLVNRLRAIDCSYVCVSTMNVFCFYGVSNGDVNEFFSGRLCLHFIW